MVLTAAGNMPGLVNSSTTAGNTGQTVSTIQKKDVEEALGDLGSDGDVIAPYFATHILLTEVAYG